MPDITEQLERMEFAREEIIQAITDKGGTVAEDAGYEDLAEAIRTIPTT